MTARPITMPTVAPKAWTVRETMRPAIDEVASARSWRSPSMRDPRSLWGGGETSDNGPSTSLRDRHAGEIERKRQLYGAGIGAEAHDHARHRRREDVERERADRRHADQQREQAPWMRVVAAHGVLAQRPLRIKHGSMARCVCKPGARVDRDRGVSLFGDARVIAVEPGDLLLGHQCGLDQPNVDRCERERLDALTGFSAPATPSRPPARGSRCGCRRRLRGSSRVRSTGSCRVERDRGAALGNAGRAFVHRQIAADAVPVPWSKSMRLPTVLARERVELRARDAVGNTARRAAMWPFSTRVKRSRISAVGYDENRAGDVRGAVFVLAPLSSQEQLVIPDSAVGGSRHAVMHDRAVRSGARDGWE